VCDVRVCLCAFVSVCVFVWEATDRVTERATDRQTHRQTDRQGDRQTGWQTHRQGDRQTGWQKDRQTDMHLMKNKRETEPNEKKVNIKEVLVSIVYTHITNDILGIPWKILNISVIKVTTVKPCTLLSEHVSVFSIEPTHL